MTNSFRSPSRLGTRNAELIPASVFRVLFILCTATILYAVAARAGENEVGPGIPAPETILIPSGPYITGSDRAEREAAYLLDEAAYGHSATRRGRWYESEPERQNVDLPAYNIMKNLVTNADYALFVADTGYRAPDVDRETWEGYGLIHPYERTRRYAWLDGRPPEGRENHPIVMVSHDDAEAYAEWLSTRTGAVWRLPSEAEWEKAARGTDGRRFPWGEDFDSNLLNSHDGGPFDTMPVGQFPAGESPFGMLDPAGQVFEWTSTPANPGRWIVKGGSWDDRGCGICRPSARHSRPNGIKHILVGFRLVLEQVE